MDKDTDEEKSRQEPKEALRKIREPNPEVMKRVHEEWERMVRIDPRSAYPFMTKHEFERMMIERNRKI